MEKAIIAAIADNYAIGKGNDMPWHISEDLKFFKRTTLGCPVIMGSRTFRSIGSRALPKRTNIVITRSPDLELPEGVLRASDLEQAYRLAELVCNSSEGASERCFVIGGGRVYGSAIGDADVMFITHVHTNIEDADTFFPLIDPNLWEKVSVSETCTDAESGYDYEFAEYRRK